MEEDKSHYFLVRSYYLDICLRPVRFMDRLFVFWYDVCSKAVLAGRLLKRKMNSFGLFRELEINLLLVNFPCVFFFYLRFNIQKQQNERIDVRVYLDN